MIGKDTRRSSYMFEYALCTGLMASGADAYIMHVTTTPSVAYITRVDDFDCGIMISASHNPYYDNGIKLLNGNGEKMDEETILKVEDYIDGKLEIPLATRDDRPYGRLCGGPQPLYRLSDLHVQVQLQECQGRSGCGQRCRMADSKGSI